MASFGAALRRTREEKGISLDEIAGETRLSKRYLLALEDEAIHKLPGGTYNRAYLRSYAGYLGLDTERLVREYSLEEAHQTETGRLQPQPDVLTSIGKAVESRQTTTGAQRTWNVNWKWPGGRAGRIAIFAGLGSLAVLLLAAVLWLGLRTFGRDADVATASVCRGSRTCGRGRAARPRWPRCRRMKRRNSLERRAPAPPPAASTSEARQRGSSPGPATSPRNRVAPASKGGAASLRSPRSGRRAAEGSIDGASGQATTPVSDRLRSRHRRCRQEAGGRVRHVRGRHAGDILDPHRRRTQPATPSIMSGSTTASASAPPACASAAPTGGPRAANCSRPRVSGPSRRAMPRAVCSSGTSSARAPR